MFDGKLITQVTRPTQSRASVSISGEMPVMTDEEAFAISDPTDSYDLRSQTQSSAERMPVSPRAKALLDAESEAEECAILFGTGFKVVSHKIQPMDRLRTKFVSALGRSKTVTHPVQRFSVSHEDGSRIDIHIRPVTKGSGGRVSFSMDFDVIERGFDEKHLSVIDQLMARDKRTPA